MPMLNASLVETAVLCYAAIALLQYVGLEYRGYGVADENGKALKTNFGHRRPLRPCAV